MKNKLIIFSLALVMVSCASQKKVYLFTSFHEPATAGLRMLYSKDGYNWKDLDTVLIRPTVGNQQVMRDPSIVQGPDKTFHFVWTSSWKGDKGFGYASSKDLIHWSKQQFIPVMQHEPNALNVWAPELFYDDVEKQFIILWASCIPGRFERGIEPDSNNHRMYVTTTKDFTSFTPTRLFLDPGFSVIDAQIVKRAAKDYVLVLKDNTRPNRNIRVAFSNNALGPYTNISAGLTEKLTEGPTAVKVKDDWLIYFDSYGKKKYGTILTKDFISFTSIDSLVNIPEGHKHGTIFRASNKILKGLLKYSNTTK